MPRRLTSLERCLIDRLRPFADFHVEGAPERHVITSGSSMARRQLTMGDCREAYELLRLIDGGRQ